MIAEDLFGETLDSASLDMAQEAAALTQSAQGRTWFVMREVAAVVTGRTT